MNKLQELLTITMEECGELIQVLRKQLGVMIFITIKNYLKKLVMLMYDRFNTRV